jgi:hypothetical protein
VPRAEIIRPASSGLGNKGPLDGTTTYGKSFVPKQVEVQRAVNPQAPYEKKEWLEAPGTEYRGRFFEKGVPAASAKPVRAPFVSLPFEGTSAYNADFVPKATETVRAARPNNGMVQTGPFDGTSTYAQNFINKEVPYERAKGPQRSMDPTGPFDGNTANKSDYKNYGPQAPRTPARSNSLPREPLPFEGSTTYGNEFVKKAVGRPPLARPVRNPLENLPFDGSTTYGKVR